MHAHTYVYIYIHIYIYVILTHMTYIIHAHIHGEWRHSFQDSHSCSDED